MKKLVIFHFWLLFVLCLAGHGAVSFAANEQAGASCVEEDTLRGFYEKFSLIEKEKEALRNKLSVCSSGQNEQSSLGIGLSQKEGRELRILESRLAQLEEENKALREKLKDGDPEKDSSKTSSDASDSKASPAVSPAAEPLQDPVLPLKADLEPEQTAAEPEAQSDSSNTAPPPPATTEIAPEEEQDRNTEPPTVETEKDTSELNLIETKSGEDISVADIRWNGPRVFGAVYGPVLSMDSAPVPGSEDRCAQRREAFEKKLLSLSSDSVEQKSISELGQSLILNLSNSRSSDSGGDLDKGEYCSGALHYEDFSHFLDGVEDELDLAESPQRAIQLLYEKSRKAEALARQTP